MGLSSHIFSVYNLSLADIIKSIASYTLYVLMTSVFIFLVQMMSLIFTPTLKISSHRLNRHITLTSRQFWVPPPTCHPRTHLPNVPHLNKWHHCSPTCSGPRLWSHFYILFLSHSTFGLSGNPVGCIFKYIQNLNTSWHIYILPCFWRYNRILLEKCKPEIMHPPLPSPAPVTL